MTTSESSSESTKCFILAIDDVAGISAILKEALGHACRMCGIDDQNFEVQVVLPDQQRGRGLYASGSLEQFIRRHGTSVAACLLDPNLGTHDFEPSQRLYGAARRGEPPFTFFSPV